MSILRASITTKYTFYSASVFGYAISRVLYSAETEPPSFIYDGNHLPPPATYPPTLDEQPLVVGIHGLATHETYSRGVLLPSRWALTPPSHPYPCGRSFSSTLLYTYAYQAVNLRGALCCSDFPPPHKVAAMERISATKVRKRCDTATLERIFPPHVVARLTHRHPYN